MKVKDLILYQVATDRNYKVGDEITLETNQTDKNLIVLIFHLIRTASHYIN